MKFRQVHLDFHTSEKIDGIGNDFSKENFQRALINGHVNSITLFSKCHHGWSYHPTDANEMHPHLDFDLFGAQIEAAKEIGVNVVGYISAGLDEKYAVKHPEALARRRDEKIIRTPDFSVAGYHLLCFNSSYLDVLAAQVTEMCERYPVSGVFLDIVKPTKCYCRNCIAIMEKEGLDPDNESHVAIMAQRTYEKYTKRMREAIDAVDKSLTLFHNGGATPRGRRNIALMNSHIEIESLPTGGWGYDNLPMTSRYVQSLGVEYLGMTGKFHLSWGEFGGYKHENALIYETALAVANGGKCSVGDQLHPCGEMDDETYRIIGSAYSRIEEREEWLDGVSAVADVGILSYDAWLVRHPAEFAADTERKLSDIGALRILLESHFLFDVLDEESDLSKYKLLILPDNVLVDEPLKVKLDEYVKGGGKILASGRSALGLDEDGVISDFVYDLGASHCGALDIKPSYLNVERELNGVRRANYVLYSDTQKAELSKDGVALAGISEPYFERSAKHFCSHFHAPEKKERVGVGVSEGKHGIYIANAIFREYASVGSLIAKQIVVSAIERLLGNKKTLCAELPAQGIVTLMEQKEHSRSILHLLYAQKTAKGSNKIEVIEDCVPLYNVPVSLKTNGRIPKRVYSAPSYADIEYSLGDNGSLRFNVPRVDIHEIVVVEWDERRS